MRETYDELIEVFISPEFSAMHAELMNLPERQRMAFVLEVMLSATERKKRGVELPDGVLLQTSAFGDRRPTLYVIICIKNCREPSGIVKPPHIRRNGSAWEKI